MADSQRIPGRRITNFLKILAVLLALWALWDIGWRLAGVKVLFPWEMGPLVTENQGRVAVLDVRTPMEYSWFHIPGVPNLPFTPTNEISFMARDTSLPIVVVCMTGHRSSLVARRLLDEGYTNVYSLSGGMVGWVLFGGNTVQGKGISGGKGTDSPGEAPLKGPRLPGG